ncbi:DUF2914 domain-containing protein [Marinobacter sp. SS21]|uniref:DUF2914 domain-containing protein n=1 Tax=Marinobacter sp. SS21 TaxID=2979460 RepID=UPI0023308A56|nr:DUF2914 domain-containing protein [Marinobacter sp. SS21]MDC0664290.1 DUF2914 domain-containing protein [Marinobacter sp. SS21]
MYHWGRILGALSLVLLTVSVVVWGLWQWQFSDDKAAQAAPGTIAYGEDSGESMSQPPERTQPSNPIETPPTLPLQAFAPGSAGNDHLAIQAAPEQPQLIREPDTVFPAEVAILSPQLVRVQLTSGLNAKEPVDELPASIELPENELLRIYLFTETRNLNGKLVYHDWSRNGRRMARVPIRLYSDTMRASSSKFIDRHMLGFWRVTVVNARGEVYASVEFDVIPEQDHTKD